ncbi:hypothetical protein JW711_06335 [Candidatus Woesearchaeota archaeon]|nr:hypothetical protein [Candidatus Woesearchaeota archaeon]
MSNIVSRELQSRIFSLEEMSMFWDLRLQTGSAKIWFENLKWEFQKYIHLENTEEAVPHQFHRVFKNSHQLVEEYLRNQYCTATPVKNFCFQISFERKEKEENSKKSGKNPEEIPKNSGINPCQSLLAVINITKKNKETMNGEELVSEGFHFAKGYLPELEKKYGIEAPLFRLRAVYRAEEGRITGYEFHSYYTAKKDSARYTDEVQNIVKKVQPPKIHIIPNS